MDLKCFRRALEVCCSSIRKDPEIFLQEAAKMLSGETDIGDSDDFSLESSDLTHEVQGSCNSVVIRTARKKSFLIEAVALYEYHGSSDNELTLKPGQSVTVLSTHQNGWWFGTSDSAKGFFPGSYVKEIEPESLVSEPSAATLSSLSTHWVRASVSEEE